MIGQCTFHSERLNRILNLSFSPFAVMFLSIYLMYGLSYLPIIYILSQMFLTMSSLYSFLTYMFVIFCKYSCMKFRAISFLFSYHKFSRNFFPRFLNADIIASFMSSSEDNIKSYSLLIDILLVIPDYGLSHAISCLLLTYVKQHDAQINFNFGK